MTDVSELMAGIADTQASLNEYSDQYAAAYMQARELSDLQIADAMRAGDLAGVVQAANSAQKLQFEERKQATGALFGTDILDPNNQIAILAQQQKDTFDAAMQKKAEVDRLGSMNFFEGPLDYLFGASQIKSQMAEYNSLAEKNNMLEQRISILNQQTQSTVQTQKALTTEYSKEEAAAELELTSLKARQAVAALRAGQNKAQMDQITYMKGMTKDNLALDVQAYSIKTSHDQYVAQQKIQEEQRAENAARKAELDALKKSKMDAEQAALYDQEQELRRYNIGASVLGMPEVLSLQDYKKIPEGRRAKVAARGDALYNQVDLAPEDPNNPITMVQPAFSNSAGEAFITMKEIPGSSLGKTANRVEQFVNDVGQRTFTGLQKDGRLTKDNAAPVLTAEINKFLQDSPPEKGPDNKVKPGQPGLLTRMKSDVEVDIDRYKNIYAAPDMDTIASSYPTLMQNPVMAYLADASKKAASGGKVTVEHMFNQAHLMAASGKADPEIIGAHLNAYYKAAVKLNNVTNGYERVGLTPQTSYVVQLDMPTYEGGTPSKVRVDMMNLQSVQAAMLKYRAIAAQQASWAEGRIPMTTVPGAVTSLLFN
jgi:hypothetical protein